MAKITRKETLLLTRTEAHNLIKNADGRVRFQFRVTSFMPTEGDKGFEGLTYISLSKKEAMSTVLHLLSETLQARGARLQVETHPANYPGGLSFITVN